MLLWALLAALAALSTADDRSDCIDSCPKPGDDTGSGCRTGCELRGNLSTEGFPEFFIKCHRGCDAAFEPKTEEAQADGCHFACQLPKTTRILMTVDLKKPGDKPVIKYTRYTGKLDSDSAPMKPLGLEQDVDEDEDHLDGAMFGRADPSDFAKYWMRKTQEMREQMDAMLQRAGFKPRPLFSMQDPGHDTDDDYERPLQRQHLDFPRTGRPVGNVNAAGRAILDVQPVHDDDSDEVAEGAWPIRELLYAMPQEVEDDAPYYTHSRTSTYLQIAIFSLCILIIMAAVSLLLSLIQRRRETIDAFERAMLQWHTCWGRRDAPGAGTAPPYAVVAKLRNDSFKAPPSEGAPPAYDQLSIHKPLHKMDDE